MIQLSTLITIISVIISGCVLSIHFKNLKRNESKDNIEEVKEITAISVKLDLVLNEIQDLKKIKEQTHENSKKILTLENQVKILKREIENIKNGGNKNE